VATIGNVWNMTESKSLDAAAQPDIHALDFYLAGPHPCNYLPGRMAGTLYADPYQPTSTALYSRLIDHGFRRSGEYLYRPHCQGCEACIPVRIPVAEFQPTRNQLRTWQRNQDLTVRAMAGLYREDHFHLYQRYLASRHPGGGMDGTAPEQYQSFLLCAGLDTQLYEFRNGDQLLAVAVTDHLEQGLSAVYTFFDPAQPTRSLGRYSILWQIHEAQRLGLPWLYLGYWIKECRKMSYKDEYHPLETYLHGRWSRMVAPATLVLPSTSEEN